MAFMKYAKAQVLHSKIGRKEWSAVRKKSLKIDSSNVRTANFNGNLVDRASEIFKSQFNPDNYLLTHATIVASVDTHSPSEVKLGNVLEDGFRVNRKYSNFRVNSNCSKFLNNNMDGWDRDVLLKSYPTFIGAHNFLEHVQIEDQSKGRVIDAVARDIGPSVYIDILVATDRKNKELVKAINNGNMGTLSMGCFVPGTLVTMSDGTRLPIEEIAPGDMVLTHKGRPREVLNKQIRGGEWNMRTIKAVGLASPITSTDNHPFYVIRPLQVCQCGCGENLPSYSPSSEKPTTRALSRRFKAGHDKRILNSNGIYSLEEFRKRKNKIEEIKKHKLEKVRADELQVGDLIAFPRITDNENTVSVSNGKARLLGYFLAKGSFNKRKGRRTTVAFSFSMDEKNTYVNEVARLLEEEFPGKNKPWIQNREERNTCIVHLTNSKAADWFFKHGGEYSHGKTISPQAMNWSSENHNHLIGTWLNGDGCKNKSNGSLSGTTVSLNLASQMHALMAKCGIFARFEARIGSKSVSVAEAVSGGFAVRNETTGRLPAFILTIENTQAAQLHGFCSKAPEKSFYGNHNFRILDNWAICPITSIESSVYSGWVHDMEVEEDHTYIVEGASVSNCTVSGTQCTKCGHWAADETEMCHHIKYGKGNVFYDEMGLPHKVAELCGHSSIDPTGGVQFIEASWVDTPAFTGAVMRNILEPSSELTEKAANVLRLPPPQWSENSYLKAASDDFVFAGWEEEGEEGEGEGEGEGEEEKEPANPLKEVEDEITKHMLTRVKQRLKDEMKGRDVEKALDTTETNNNLQHTAQKLLQEGISILTRTASSDAQLVDGVAHLHQISGIQFDVNIYRSAVKAGTPARYRSKRAYLRSCSDFLGRSLNRREASQLLFLGNLIEKNNKKGNIFPI